MIHLLNQAAVQRATMLAQSSYRPPEIRQLTEAIEGEERAAEVRLAITGEVDAAVIDRIVGMKLQLDALYADWAEGTLK